MAAVSEVLSRDDLREMLDGILVKKGRKTADGPPVEDSADLRELGFRSLDFSDLALQVEEKIGRELDFDQPGLNDVTRAGEVLDFLARM